MDLRLNICQKWSQEASSPGGKGGGGDDLPKVVKEEFGKEETENGRRLGGSFDVSVGTQWKYKRVDT